MISTTAGPMITSISPIEVVKISTAPTITGERTYRTASAPRSARSRTAATKKRTGRDPQERDPVVAERGEELVAQDLEQERERDRDGGDRVAGPVAELARVVARGCRAVPARRPGRPGGAAEAAAAGRRAPAMVDHRSPF